MKLHPAAKFLSQFHGWIYANVERGVPFAQAARKFSRRHDGRVVNGVRPPLSERSIRRHHPAWLAKRGPEAFTIRYTSARKTSPAVREALIAGCLSGKSEQITTVAAHVAREYGVSARTCIRLLTKGERLAIRAIAKARKDIDCAERLLLDLVVLKNHRLNPFETGRNRLETAPSAKMATLTPGAGRSRVLGQNRNPTRTKAKHVR